MNNIKVAEWKHALITELILCNPTAPFVIHQWNALEILGAPTEKSSRYPQGMIKRNLIPVSLEGPPEIDHKYPLREETFRGRFFYLVNGNFKKQRALCRAQKSEMPSLEIFLDFLIFWILYQTTCFRRSPLEALNLLIPSNLPCAVIRLSTKTRLGFISVALRRDEGLSLDVVDGHATKVIGSCYF